MTLSVRGGYYEPIYDYTGLYPEFTGKWMHVISEPIFDSFNPNVGDSLPVYTGWALWAAEQIGKKFNMPTPPSPVTYSVLVVSVVTGVNNMVKTRFEISTSIWQHPSTNSSVPVPYSNRFAYPNPNGLGYPMPY